MAESRRAADNPEGGREAAGPRSKEKPGRAHGESREPTQRRLPASGRSGSTGESWKSLSEGLKEEFLKEAVLKEELREKVWGSLERGTRIREV